MDAPDFKVNLAALRRSDALGVRRRREVGKSTAKIHSDEPLAGRSTLSDHEA
jgi:hypothetical protein